jgi:AcrR family transcriptional regulator
VARREQVIDAALEIVERDGREALTVRRVAAEVGIQAPSLYKHFRGKVALEQALATAAAAELARALARARSLDELFGAYRAFARSRPRLYRLVASGPAASEADVPEAFQRIAGDADLARALWAFAHGLVHLELSGRVPAGAELDAAWWEGTEAFRAWSE